MEQFNNWAVMALAAPCGSGDATITITNPTALATSGTYPLVCESEIMTVTARSGAVVSVLRGQEGTAAAAHDIGKAVTPNLTARSLQQLLLDSQITIEDNGGAAMPLRKIIRFTGGLALGDDGTRTIVPVATPGGGAVISRPGAANTWTVLGSMALADMGGGILGANSVVGAPETQALAPIPGGVTPAGPWALSLVGYARADAGTTYPEFGVVVANGLTVGTSIALFTGWYQFSSNTLSLGAWTEILATAARPYVYYGTNALDLIQGSLFTFRLICDGTYYFWQSSQDGGATYRTYFQTTKAIVLSTSGMGDPTHYGLTMGATNGSGIISAILVGIEIAPIPQVTITNIVLTGGSLRITTSTAHGLAIGDSVTLTGIVSTGAAVPNGVYLNGAVVTGATALSVLLQGSQDFTYVSDGTVTKIG